MIGNELCPLDNPSFSGPPAGNSRIAEPYSDLSKLFRRRCRIIRAAVPRARIRHNPGVLHCIITYPLHYCVSGESEPDRAPDPGQTRPGRIGRAGWPAVKPWAWGDENSVRRAITEFQTRVRQ